MLITTAKSSKRRCHVFYTQCHILYFFITSSHKFLLKIFNLEIFFNRESYYQSHFSHQYFDINYAYILALYIALIFLISEMLRPFL